MKAPYPLPGKFFRVRAFITAFLTVSIIPPLFATNYTVTNTSDAGAGSLRIALTSALAAGAGPHTIDATGITGTISLQSALPTITGITLTISGPLASTGTLTITRGVAGNFRIFNISNSVSPPTVTLNRLILTNGNPGTAFTDLGGGIRIATATVTLNYVTVSGCSAINTDGGGISLEGTNPTLTMDNCKIINNSANRGAGLSGISITGTGTLTVSNSIFSGNVSGGNAGGLNLTQTTGTFKNCTISGNRATTSNGGGLMVGSSGSATLVNCTVTNNRAEGGAIAGGIRCNSGSPLVLMNSLVVGNFAGASPSTTADDITWNASGITSKTATYSVVGALTGQAFNTVSQSNVGTTGSPAIVNLGTLANNGGFTQTHRLLTSTPELAKDKGVAPSPALTNDERGAPRTIDDGAVTNASGGNGSDLGAYEIGNFVWNGAASAVFDNSTGGNWVETTAPSTALNAYILEGPVTSDPVVSSNVTFNNLVLGSGRTLTINSGNTLTVSSTLTQNGILKGNGTLVNANLTNAGIISPGNSPGKLSLTGNFDNGSGAMNMELGGATTAGTDYDQFAVSGTATLSGTLNVSFVSAFTPTMGDQFVIMTYASKTGTFATTNLPDISPNFWTLTYNATNIILKADNSSLPLRLLNFSGKLLTNTQAQLNWQTTSEQDMKGFELEWSNDAMKWQTVSNTSARNVAGTQSYSYLHNQISSMNFYRLKMVDLGGKFTYSQILRLERSPRQGIMLYPNPAKEFVTITLSATKPSMIHIIDNNGKIVMQQKLNATAVTLNIGSLPTGIYSVRIIQDEKTTFSRFVKE